MSNVQLSAEEMKLVVNSGWILTKHRVIEKVYALFGHVAGQMQHYAGQLAPLLPAQVLQLPPKISKGEQYEALPYVVLDYPRIFSKENVFAIRSFFWWGNYFSITLHLKGTYLQQHFEKIAAAAAGNLLGDFYFSTEGNEFSFNLAGKNYFFSGDKRKLPVHLQAIPFIKISYKISLDQWNTAEQKFIEAFERFVSLCAYKN